MLAGTAAAGWSVPALAQVAAEPGAERPGIGQTIIVTAERRATNLQDTPLSIVAVTQETIAAKGIEDLADLSRFTPNLSITPTRGGGNNTASFVIRGISGGGGATGERGVGLYIDGIYMPRTSGAVLSVLDIERIEILRGPQGTLFGRNSTGGAIRIFSKQPTDTFEGYLRGTVANMDRTDLVGSINLPLTDGVALRAQGAYLDRGGFVSRGTEELGEERDMVGRLQLRIEPSDRFRATLGVMYNESQSNGTPMVFKEFDMRPGIEGVVQGNYADWINDAFKLAGQAPLAAYNDERIVRGPLQSTDLCFLDDFNPDYDAACDQSLESGYWQADLNLAYDLSDTVTLSSITGYSTLEYRGVSDYQVLGTEARRENVDSEVIYQELQLNAELLGGLVDLVTGGNYFHEKSSAPNFIITRRGTSVFPSLAQQAAVGFNINSPTFARGDADAGLFRTADTITSQVSDSYGLFVSATLHPTDRVNITGGLRYAVDKKDYRQTRFPASDFFPAPGTTSTTVQSDAKFDAIDYRFTGDYHVTDDIMAYITISKAYKAGSYSYTIANRVPGDLQSAGIRPIPNEKVINYEAGIRATLFDRLRINPTVFIMDYTNRQAAVQVTCGTGVLAGIAPNSPQCPVGFLIQVQNQGDVRLTGFEVDAQLEITPNFYLDGGFAATSPKLSNAPAGTVNLYPDAPSPTYNIGATWSVDSGFGEVTVNANYAYVGKQETHPTRGTDSSYTLPSYGLVNARLKLELERIPLSITAFANNLLDKTYATYGQRFGGGFWDSGAGTGLAAPLRSALSQVRGRPREVGLTLQHNF
jgi:iron complex outermembrane receptor protein